MDYRRIVSNCLLFFKRLWLFLFVSVWGRLSACFICFEIVLICFNHQLHQVLFARFRRSDFQFESGALVYHTRKCLITRALWRFRFLRAALCISVVAQELQMKRKTNGQSLKERPRVSSRKHLGGSMCMLFFLVGSYEHFGNLRHMKVC